MCEFTQLRQAGEADAVTYRFLDRHFSPFHSGRTSHSFMEGPVVTVSVDFGMVQLPIRRGELVQATACVAAVGSSSITVQVVTRKEILGSGTPHFVDCFTAQLTFVAINKVTHRPYKNVPKLEKVEGSDEAKLAAEVQDVKAAIRESVSLLKKIDADPASALPTEADPEEMAVLRASRMSIDDSRIDLRKQYLPRHENFGGSVFGMYLSGCDYGDVNFALAPCTTLQPSYL